MGAMTKKPKDAKTVRWGDFTKAELIRTIRSLDRRQTTLLNQIAKLEAGKAAVAKTIDPGHDVVHVTQDNSEIAWPWETK